MSFNLLVSGFHIHGMGNSRGLTPHPVDHEPQHESCPKLGWKAGGALIKFFFITAVLIYPLTPRPFSRQSYKSGYGGVKAASISQVELENANRERKKNSDFFFN